MDQLETSGLVITWSSCIIWPLLYLVKSWDIEIVRPTLSETGANFSVLDDSWATVNTNSVS